MTGCAKRWMACKSAWDPRLVLVSALLALGAMGTSPALAQSGDTLFARGNAALTAGRYAQADALYTKLVNAGIDDADVHYNQGVARAQDGKLGLALVSFHRAQVLSPNDQEVATALSDVRRILAERQANRDGEGFFSEDLSLSEALFRPFSEPLLAWLALLAHTLAWLSWSLARRAEQERRRFVYRTSAAFSIVLLLLSALGVAVKRGEFHDGRVAFVGLPDTLLHEGPDARAATSASLAEGAAIYILDEERGWFRIKLAEGQGALGKAGKAHLGWVPRQAIEPLVPFAVEPLTPEI